ncbi:MAG: choice-of-anchor X domain-containing protein, partial [Candidatus Hodarchaeota archaeon]
TMSRLSPPNGFVSHGWATGEPVGTPIPFLVSITDDEGIESAEVSMEVIPPGYESHGIIFRIDLYDDGQHGDELPGDGLYGNLFTPTSEAGSYQYIITAIGETNDGDKFSRVKTGAFRMSQPRKVRDIGLPDNWEAYYGLDSYATGIKGADDDSDLDGLSNADEFFWGTDPFNPDTDFGGEADGSEVTNGRNPLVPKDDTITKFTYVRMFPENNEVIIAVPLIPYTTLKIFRSTDPMYGFTEIYNGAYKNFTDSDVDNYITHYYRFIATQGRAFSVSKVFSTIPKEVVVAPEVCVILNGGAKEASSNNVNVTIVVTKNDLTSKLANAPTHMRYSEDPADLLTKSWSPFTANFEYSFSLGLGIKILFVQLRDDQPVPEVSPIFTAGISYIGASTVTSTTPTTPTTTLTTSTSESWTPTIPTSTPGFESIGLLLSLITTIAVLVAYRKRSKE